MAGGSFVDSGNTKQFDGKVTVFVLVTCFVAAMGGLLFGYDLGITGGVTSMEPFLVKFFPSVYKQMKDESSHESQYCKFDNELLTLFTSSLYLAALVASFLCIHNHKDVGTQDLNVSRWSVFPCRCITQWFCCQCWNAHHWSFVAWFWCGILQSICSSVFV